MKDKRIIINLSETHHAVLFALLAKQTILHFGQLQGEASVRKALRKYGNQRGKRMALRAQAEGQALTMANYLIFGEWKPSGMTETQNEMEEKFPDVRMKATICPWNNAWKGFNLLDYGRIYCQEIDQALVNGFNPDLFIEMGKTLSNDGEPCEFVYRNASLIDRDSLQIIHDRRLESQAKNIMPWDYHCGHLLHTFQEMLINEFGTKGQKAIQAALNDFTSLFPEDTTQSILDAQETDFDQLPEGASHV